MSEFAARRERVARELAPRKLDALIVSAPPNVRYLSGFTGSNGTLLVAAGGSLLLTDPRYGIQAIQETDCAVGVVRGPFAPGIMKAAARRRLRRIGFEAARVSFGAYEELRAQLPLGGSLEAVGGLVETLRLVKSGSEAAAIRNSVETNSKAFDRAVKRLKPGMTESAFAAEIEYQMRLLGAEKPAFETIVASGPHTALPHARPRTISMRAGLVLVDMGCMRDGYASDMTRMLYLGTPPAKLKRLYRAVLEAQLAAVDAVRPGIPAARVDRAARRVLRGFGFDELFVHSTGHGLGLEIHEPPRVGKREKMRLEAGMTITIEPGAYLEGYGGVRIEDTVLVTQSGCEILTPTPKSLVTL